MNRCLCVALLGFAIAGCNQGTPAPKRPPLGVVWIYDGARLLSTNRGEEFRKAEFQKGAGLKEVEFAFKDGSSLAPLAVTKEVFENYQFDMISEDHDGAGNFQLSARTGYNSNLTALYKSNALESVTFTDSTSSFVKLRIRGKIITLPAKGEEIKQLLGEPDSIEEMSVLMPVH
jgi:hypothetical protein